MKLWFLIAFACVFGGCAAIERSLIPTVQTTPNDLRIGSSTLTARLKMGKPLAVDYHETGGQTWYYYDLWWQDQSWGSWKLHFDKEKDLIGWELIDPMSNQDFNRAAFFMKPPKKK